MKLDVPYVQSFYDRIAQMPEVERLALDDIARAIQIYRRQYDGKGWRVLAGRREALAAIDAAKEIERVYIEN